jgi:hypothetical protein
VRSAAQSLYPHLPSGDREPVKQKERTLADALFPTLSRAGKQREADQTLWDAINKRNRDNFLKAWRGGDR